MQEVTDKLLKCVENIAQREGCFLYDMEIVGAGRGRVVRVFIDKDDTEGVSIDDCARVSRALDLILDMEDLVPGGAYNLEVSSPGLERKLRLPWHFAKAIGEKVNLQLNAPLGEIDPTTPPHECKRKKLAGHVCEYSDGQIKVMLTESAGEQGLMIPLTQIKTAKVVFEFDTNKKKKM